MDIEFEQKIKETIEQLQQLAVDGINYADMDPIAKMMLIALINEGQKIRDSIENTPQRVLERYCSDFIPHDKVGAVPAITILAPTFKANRDLGFTNIGAGSVFTYRTNLSKQTLNYIPLFNTSTLPYSDIFVATSNKVIYQGGIYSVQMDYSNHVWIGIVTRTEIESLKGVSLLIKGTNGIAPEHIYVGQEDRELDFSTMREMENIEMVEPFDAQQASGELFSFMNQWKECLLNMDNHALIYITDDIHDRDLFKHRVYPRLFQQYLEDEVLNCFTIPEDSHTLWLKCVFPEGYKVPDTFEVQLNTFPVVNVDVCNLTLTQAAPIAKLQKYEDSYFLRIIETSSVFQKQGFSQTQEEVIIRDFDASCYHNGDLYRDVRNLYNKFIDDYYAFIEYNGIKDGEVLKQLRDTINKLGKSVGNRNAKFNFDSGTYVMKNMNQYPPSISTKVSFITTQGKAGNAPMTKRDAEQHKTEYRPMENRKLPAIEKDLHIVVSAMGGANKASADERYELLRYFTLTNDRLYTKMDIDAFLRKEIIAAFGKGEFQRINIKINIEGAGGDRFLQRGLYIDLEFKDKKNYDKAIDMSFDKLMKQKIEGKSCIAMPIFIQMTNIEKGEEC